MSWTHIPETGPICVYPFFWWLKPTGSTWQCPECDKTWEIKDNPDRFIGGRIMVPQKSHVSPRCGK